ncbi:hypothetical protein [Runella sp.]|uniref:hypothetical protein n=1 Tax=Runella sp. TaxID=1960881 RepID=UPI00262BD7C2|nr:hypothetical protein [Runella sp.]
MRGIIYKLPNANKHATIMYFSDKSMLDDASEINSLLNDLNLLKRARTYGDGIKVKVPTPE